MITCWYAKRALEGGLRAEPSWVPSFVSCSGAVQFRVHDRRGCVLVCSAHAEWRKTTSQAIGHSADCPNAGDKLWRQITQETSAMNDDNTTVPGIEATRKWIEENGTSINRFAIDNGLDPSEFSKLLKKKSVKHLSVETAVKIERGTKGAVTAEMFVPVRREGT